MRHPRTIAASRPELLPPRLRLSSRAARLTQYISLSSVLPGRVFRLPSRVSSLAPSPGHEHPQPPNADWSSRLVARGRRQHRLPPPPWHCGYPAAFDSMGPARGTGQGPSSRRRATRLVVRDTPAAPSRVSYGEIGVPCRWRRFPGVMAGQGGAGRKSGLPPPACPEPRRWKLRDPRFSTPLRRDRLSCEQNRAGTDSSASGKPETRVLRGARAVVGRPPTSLGISRHYRSTETSPGDPAFRKAVGEGGGRGGGTAAKRVRGTGDVERE